MKRLCPAKVNLSLHILQKRADGFHDLLSVFQKISLFDEVSFSEAGKNSLSVQSDSELIDDSVCRALEKDNLLLDILQVMQERYDLPALSLHLTKRIPLGAGLGGGSSDAAGLILSLNEHYKLRLYIEEMSKIGAEFGSDIPFFIYPQATAEVLGRGEVVRPMESLPWQGEIVLANPAINISTKEAYGQLVQREQPENCQKKFESFKELLYNTRPQASEQSMLKRLRSFAFNGFQQGACRQYPHLADLLAELEKFSPYALLSGSGSTCFALVEAAEDAKKLSQALKNKPVWSYQAQFLVNDV